MEARLPRPRTTSAALPRRFLAVSGLIAVLFGLGLLTSDITERGSAPGPAFAGREYIVFAQFGSLTDTIYEAPADKPSGRKKLLEIAHAPEFGIVPSLAPDGRRFAYVALPTGTRAPSPDTPAELWLASLDVKVPPERLGRDFDLLVRPLWTPDGAALVLRRSSGSAGPYTLSLFDLSMRANSTLVDSEAALFPVGFASAGGPLYYVAIHSGGSDLHRIDLDSGVTALVSHLSDDLTRDWALSPSGSRLAFLTLAQSGGRVSSRVQVLDLDSGEFSSSGGDADEFGPTWSLSGELAFGRLSPSRSNTGIVLEGGFIAGGSRGFDVPLAWSPSGGSIAARTFDNPSVTNPGRTMLSLLTASGDRKTIAHGEVTFLGWTHR